MKRVKTPHIRYLESMLSSPFQMCGGMTKENVRPIRPWNLEMKIYFVGAQMISRTTPEVADFNCFVLLLS
jgi:hypothetical protein